MSESEVSIRESRTDPSRRLVFRVIGNDRVGMGHIFRALTLAHEINDFELIFFSDTKSAPTVEKLISGNYPLEVSSPEKAIEHILTLGPDIVVNDILDTQQDDVLPLQKRGIKVVNFEDLGEGAKYADLTINELYDRPRIEGENILWGREYFFVRDEFHDARPHCFTDEVSSLLLAFGGTDQHNLSKNIFLAIRQLCEEKGVKIYIVTGPGYTGYEKLAEETAGRDGVELTHATGVISRIMEKTPLAITSNGRTVYELAHMSIPAIVIPQHVREKTHSFACENHGFIQLMPYKKGATEIEVFNKLAELLHNREYRRYLFMQTIDFRFDQNKGMVVEKIVSQLER